MKRVRQKKVPSQRMLGLLAMQFRSTRDEEERSAIVEEYARTVAHLIESGKWNETPSFEDQLPDDRMPATFFKYWQLPVPNDRNGQSKSDG